jgi:hypothetical protein
MIFLVAFWSLGFWRNELLHGASWQAYVSSGGAVQAGSRAVDFPDLYKIVHQHNRLSYLAEKQMVESASNQSNLCMLWERPLLAFCPPEVCFCVLWGSCGVWKQYLLCNTQGTSNTLKLLICSLPLLCLNGDLIARESGSWAWPMLVIKWGKLCWNSTTDSKKHSGYQA